MKSALIRAELLDAMNNDRSPGLSAAAALNRDVDLSARPSTPEPQSSPAA
ncbi:MAG TPA: hypothetical protein VKA41_06470 [Solirubrobacterales bacterium]|nr:hypothetical protein [Solirubrobacterales bacterium]